MWTLSLINSLTVSLVEVVEVEKVPVGNVDVVDARDVMSFRSLRPRALALRRTDAGASASADAESIGPSNSWLATMASKSLWGIETRSSLSSQKPGSGK